MSSWAQSVSILKLRNCPTRRFINVSKHSRQLSTHNGKGMYFRGNYYGWIVHNPGILWSINSHVILGLLVYSPIKEIPISWTGNLTFVVFATVCSKGRSCILNTFSKETTTNLTGWYNSSSYEILKFPEPYI